MQTKENKEPQPSPERETLSPALRERIKAEVESFVRHLNEREMCAFAEQFALLAKAEGYAEGRQAGAQEERERLQRAARILPRPWIDGGVTWKQWDDACEMIFGPIAVCKTCRCPAPDRSGRSCDKREGHDGPHWTYGGPTLTWVATSQPPQEPQR